jgi:6-phospho-beta-glucosidase
LRVKIAYIGGGSAYAPGVIRAIIEHKTIFAGSELVLADLEAGNLDVVRRLGEQMVRAASADIGITATTERDTALQGADFVLASFRAGGSASHLSDERIPLKYGVIGEETVGPGGFFLALRNLAVAKQLCAEIERVCPNAWLIIESGPVNIIGEAVSHFTRVRSLALSDDSRRDAYRVAGWMGYPREEVEYLGLGLNHATWSIRFTIAGMDGVQTMEHAHNRLLANPKVPNKVKRMFRLAARFGRLPSEYMQYYYFPEETLQECLETPVTRAEEIAAELSYLFMHYREQTESAHPRLAETRGGSGFGEFAGEVIAAMTTDSGQIAMVNVPNRGTVRGLPPERVTEVPCWLTSQGAAPLALGDLPGELWHLIRNLATYQATTAEVGWKAESRNAALRALATNPLVWQLSTEQLEAMYDELAQAHKEWLPPGLLHN